MIRTFWRLIRRLGRLGSPPPTPPQDPLAGVPVRRRAVPKTVMARLHLPSLPTSTAPRTPWGDCATAEKADRDAAWSQKVLSDLSVSTGLA